MLRSRYHRLPGMQLTNIHSMCPNTLAAARTEERRLPSRRAVSLGVCLQEACLGEHLAFFATPCGAEFFATVPVKTSQSSDVSHHLGGFSTPRSRTPWSSVRSQRSHCPKRYWIAPAEPCTGYQSQCSTIPGLNTPSLTSIKATCFNPASCGDSDVATSQCCEVQDQLNAGSLSTEQKNQAASHRTLHAATPGSGVRSRHGAMCTRPCYSTQIASASPVASPGSRVRGPR